MASTSKLIWGVDMTLKQILFRVFLLAQDQDGQQNYHLNTLDSGIQPILITEILLTMEFTKGLRLFMEIWLTKQPGKKQPHTPIGAVRSTLMRENLTLWHHRGVTKDMIVYKIIRLSRQSHLISMLSIKYHFVASTDIVSQKNARIQSSKVQVILFKNSKA